jgi:hypothetical protein
MLNIHDKTAFAGQFQDKFTDGSHLPEGLPRAVSEEYFQFAQFLVDTLPDTPDLGAALDDLWDSKNHAVFQAVQTQRSRDAS